MSAKPRPPRPPIRHCPVCGIAMQAGKSREDLAEFDIFHCLSCNATIKHAAPAGAGSSCAKPVKTAGSRSPK